MARLNETHDPALKSWLDSANDDAIGFPLQHLPFAVFRLKNSQQAFRPGVAIGDQIIDLAALSRLNLFENEAATALAACTGTSLNALMALGDTYWSALRLALSRALRQGSAMQKMIEPLLVPQSHAQYSMPAQVGDYTDFYISIHHATAGGKQMRPDAPLLPNYKWVPIGYHGRASSLVVSGQDVLRPVGQLKPATPEGAPAFGPCQRLDYELEMGIFIGTGNPQGTRIPIEQADKHIFGLCLLNDWSARDIQYWEYQPLGPFLAKSFATTISPWIVTREALEPFRIPFSRPAEDPQPLPYLMSETVQKAGFYDIHLRAQLSTNQSRAAKVTPATLTDTNLDQAYWAISQLVTHHTVNGCNLQPGDLFGTGTMSGPQPEQAGTFNEISIGGKQSLQLPWGEERKYLMDGDEITLFGECLKPGYPRLSFGEASGRILPSVL